MTITLLSPQVTAECCQRRLHRFLMRLSSLGQHREGESILLGSIGSTREIELW